jgi:hypothetical protein
MQVWIIKVECKDNFGSRTEPKIHRTEKDLLEYWKDAPIKRSNYFKFATASLVEIDNESILFEILQMMSYHSFSISFSNILYEHGEIIKTVELQ